MSWRIWYEVVGLMIRSPVTGTVRRRIVGVTSVPPLTSGAKPAARCTGEIASPWP